MPMCPTSPRMPRLPSQRPLQRARMASDASSLLLYMTLVNPAYILHLLQVRYFTYISELIYSELALYLYQVLVTVNYLPGWFWDIHLWHLILCHDYLSIGHISYRVFTMSIYRKMHPRQKYSDNDYDVHSFCTSSTFRPCASALNVGTMSNQSFSKLCMCTCNC
jgi:hypothetical protein